MSFLLRAALAIGVLSYLAAVRQGAEPSVPPVPSTAELARGLATLSGALPAGAHGTAALTDAAALARAASTLAESADSGDTLSASDRRPAWRGAALPQGEGRNPASPRGL